MSTNIAQNEFFIVVTPGLEALAQQELLEKWPKLKGFYKDHFTSAPIISAERGGLNLKCSLAEGWLLNAYLKIPTRILQRFASFKASDVPKLYEKTRKLEWSQYFRSGQILVEASTHGSRLSIEKQIVDVVESALRDYVERQPLRKELMDTPQTIFARIIDDEVTLSIDTSGEALFQRGYKEHTVEAPLRETLASAFIFATSKLVGDAAVVIDPMCGSGSFLTEYVGFNAATRTRQFSFQNFPCFAQNVPQFQLYDLEKRAVKVLGFDQSEDTVIAAQENLKKLSKKIKFEFKVEQQDLFDNSSSEVKNALVFINPPFGKRIDVSGGVSKYYQTIIDAVLKKYEPLALGILCPSEVRGLMTHGSYEWSKTPVLTTTGGLQVKFEILKR